jgi:hypothetical protein
MKKSMLIFALLMSFVGFSQKPSNVTLVYQYLNIEEGYDHLTKTQIWIDGTMILESPEHYESQKTTVQFEIPGGSHEISIVNLAYYEGTWEEHTVENNYSIDAVVKRVIKFKKKVRIDIIFDLDQSEPIVKIK